MSDPILLMMCNPVKIIRDKIVFNEKEYKICRGKHEVWVPDLEMKIVWTYNGKIESLKDWDKGRNKDKLLNGSFGRDYNGFDNDTIESIRQEYIIFEELASKNMSPPIYGMFHLRNVTHDVFGYELNDPLGMYGFYMKDATKLEPGSFSIDKFIKEYVDTKKINISKHALNDLSKHDNVVNGYLVDVRRTLWDMMTILDPDLLNKRSFTRAVIDKNLLRKRIRELTQFPHMRRRINYQTYYMNGKYEDGSRDTLYRYKVMKIPEDLSGKSVVDLGCNLGSMCVEAYRRGASKILGIDATDEYIDCARDLANVNCMNINYMKINLANTFEVAEYIKKFLNGKPVDILFALSLYKHIKGVFWDLLDKIDWKVCYIESNNVPKGLASNQSLEIVAGMNEKDWYYEYLGQTTDRSPRCVWKVTKE